jgi:hypothetical protein
LELGSMYHRAPAKGLRRLHLRFALFLHFLFAASTCARGARDGVSDVDSASRTVVSACAYPPIANEEVSTEAPTRIV